MRPVRVAFFCAGLCLAVDWAHFSLSPVAAEASTFVELSVADLVAKSTAVLAGTPVDARSVWEDSDGGRGRRIVTYTRLLVERVIDGQPQVEVWIRTLGGQIGDLGQHVDGEAVLTPGKLCFVFLRALADGTHAVVGMGQGHYLLEAPADGSPPRLQSPRALGRLVAKNAITGDGRPPARIVLAGQTLDDAAKLVAAERRAHAP